MSEVLRHVVSSIGPASAAHAEAARARVAAANAGVLERLAAILGGAQHTATPRVERRLLVVCAGDHGAGDPGIVLGASHPTVIAATAIAEGGAALCDVARAGKTPIVLVDAGVVEAASMPASTIRLGSTGPTRDLLRGPAMTVAEATLALEAGIALAISLSEPGLDILALGALGLGSELSAAAIGSAVHPAAQEPPFPLADDRGEPRALGSEPGFPLADEAGFVPVGRLLPDDTGVRAAMRLGQVWTGGDLELLAAFGGPDTCMLAGLILGAASLHVPVILDGHATGAAAMVAARLAPDVTGYLIASHGGSPLHGRLLTQLGLAPVFEVGLGHGEGIGAAMVFPWIDQVAALAGPR